jgi:hypothetical protein
MITMSIPFRMVHRFATFSFFDVMQVISSSTIQTIEKVSNWTKTPCIFPIEKAAKKAYSLHTKYDNIHYNLRIIDPYFSRVWDGTCYPFNAWSIY